MTPQYWLEVRSVKKVALFVLAIALIVVFWSALPEEIRRSGFRRLGRGMWSLPTLMFVGWLGGWFILLFVRAEDLNVMTPFDYQSLCRVIAVALICVSLAIAAFFSFSFFV